MRQIQRAKLGRNWPTAWLRGNGSQEKKLIHYCHRSGVNGKTGNEKNRERVQKYHV
jgi:hypothetical protein